MLLVFGGGRPAPQKRPASEIRGSEKENAKRLKEKKTHINNLGFEIEKCMEFGSFNLRERTEEKEQK